MAELRVSGVYRSFGAVRALSGVDLCVASGALVAVLGPSGCGKTTLLRCVAGFSPVDHGHIVVAGRDVTALPPERRRIAVVPQEGALFPHLSVRDNVAYGLDRAARRTGRVAEVLALVGLSGLAGRMPHQLSGGQQQRVAVARALAPRPPVVLLDEPFSALDAGLRAGLRRDVRSALQADGATAVLVTHDQGEALSMADEVAVMRDGRIIQCGPPRDVYAAPVDPWVAGFVGEAVWLTGPVVSGLADTPLGALPVAGAVDIVGAVGGAGIVGAVDGAGAVDIVGAAGGAGAAGAGLVLVMLRPEQIEVLPQGDAATVLRRDFHGHDALLTLRLPDGSVVAARVFGVVARDATVGDRVGLHVRGPARAFPP